MAQGKISFALGALSFSGEGDEKWLADQLEKIIGAVPTLGVAAAGAGDGGEGDGAGKRPTGGGTAGTLVSRIVAYGAQSNHVKRFLATADWLRLNRRLATSER